MVISVLEHFCWAGFRVFLSYLSDSSSVFVALSDYFLLRRLLRVYVFASFRPEGLISSFSLSLFELKSDVGDCVVR